MTDIGFTGSWLDRADHIRGDAEALAAAAGDWRARLLRLDRGDPAIGEDGRIAWTTLADAAEDGALLFLGLDDGGRPHFAESRPGDASGPARSPALYRMLETMPADEAAIFGTVRSLTGWHARHRFCANCGTATEVIRGGWARKCPACAAEHFPRTDPVVIMLAEFEGRALLGRGHPWPPRRYSALAGFVEPGESMEEAVAREVYEEAGVRVRDVRYVASQPWPFPGQLMIGAFATADSDVLAIDTAEIEDAMWVTRDEVRAALAGEEAPFLPPPRYAIARTLLEVWVAG
ncbi:NAD(+) diphosphatase [Sphingomonas donggukensis]|uniref:NAD(+) diphosphatase n=1 Tax=Sphingomonas donggukensis TaxID=2949093 RepID=A0ABY4TYE3_9SPHN|nr:NAD(+) diphosphatase [Sphingomonas donggukensis]URW77019.1 NAD(+) diphosphatase [Sphingomonas donggukensis]